MQAMVINQFGGPEQLVLQTIPTPVPAPGEVLIKIKARGINRAEVYMRNSAVPMQQIVDRVANGTYQAKPIKVLPFEQIPDAHRLMESDSANGKIVVVQ
jgi:NADPH:quinone reductase-like Zn-dependent oxidoreductase